MIASLVACRCVPTPEIRNHIRRPSSDSSFSPAPAFSPLSTLESLFPSGCGRPLVYFHTYLVPAVPACLPDRGRTPAFITYPFWKIDTGLQCTARQAHSPTPNLARS